jgi:hypothetical protein
MARLSCLSWGAKVVRKTKSMVRVIDRGTFIVDKLQDSCVSIYIKFNKLKPPFIPVD